MAATASVTESDNTSCGKTEIVIQEDVKRDYWTYSPGKIPSKYFEKLLPELSPMCHKYSLDVYGRTSEAKRISCVFYLNDNEVNISDRSYNMPFYGVDKAPDVILKITKIIEREYSFSPDYVLCHVYRDANDTIGWHNDREAMKTEIVGVSLGATRRFQFRRIAQQNCSPQNPSSELINNTNSTLDIYMKNGDAVHMHGERKDSSGRVIKQGCQRIYKHHVPPMTVKEIKDYLDSIGIDYSNCQNKHEIQRLMIKQDVKPIRISLTFRQFE